VVTIFVAVLVIEFDTLSTLIISVKMNNQSGSSSKLMIGVKVERFWNRHWRLLLFVGVFVLSIVLGGTALYAVSISLFRHCQLIVA